jgi:hypothetical protein
VDVIVSENPLPQVTHASPLRFRDCEIAYSNVSTLGNN